MTPRDPPTPTPPGELATDVASPASIDDRTESPADVYLIVKHEASSWVCALGPGREAAIGRAPDATIMIDSTLVSRRHARVSLEGGALVVEDLASRNGTGLNGAVLRSEKRQAAGGDVVRVGPAEIVIAVAYGRQGSTGEVDEAPSDVVVADPETVRLYALVGRLARTETTVLVTGETGAGKEVVAERLHRASPRASGPFVRLNCASLPEALLESELFGYEKGAFTGADRRKLGYFQAAEGGTLLLDEIGELPLALQPKLLRLLDTRRLTRLGATDEVAVDVRIVCATHRDLVAASGEGTFRPDLYYRISAFTLRVPPLRERPVELALLADRFVRHFARSLGVGPPPLTPAARHALAAHGWPGNVRELRNTIEYALVMSEGAPIGVEHLPTTLRGAGVEGVTSDEGRASEGGAAARDVGAAPVSAVGGGVRDRVAALEKREVEEALLAEGANQTRAAKRLGITRKALLYRMDKYGLRR